MIAAGELSRLAVPSFVVGVADADHDSSVNGNVSSVSGVDLTDTRYRWSNRLDSPDLLLSDNSAPAATLSPDGAVTEVNNILTDVEDSTEDEEGKLVIKRYQFSS